MREYLRNDLLADASAVQHGKLGKSALRKSADRVRGVSRRKSAPRLFYKLKRFFHRGAVACVPQNGIRIKGQPVAVVDPVDRVVQSVKTVTRKCGHNDRFVGATLKFRCVRGAPKIAFVYNAYNGSAAAAKPLRQLSVLLLFVD